MFSFSCFNDSILLLSCWFSFVSFWIIDCVCDISSVFEIEVDAGDT
ncbi:hypothetical protein [Spiroplasma endosymbiont of Tricholauxania praeusta]